MLVVYDIPPLYRSRPASRLCDRRMRISLLFTRKGPSLGWLNLLANARESLSENYHLFARWFSSFRTPQFSNIRTVISMPMIGQAWGFREHLCFWGFYLPNPACVRSAAHVVNDGQLAGRSVGWGIPCNQNKSLQAVIAMQPRGARPKSQLIKLKIREMPVWKSFSLRLQLLSIGIF